VIKSTECHLVFTAYWAGEGRRVLDTTVAFDRALRGVLWLPFGDGHCCAFSASLISAVDIFCFWFYRCFLLCACVCFLVCCFVFGWFHFLVLYVCVYFLCFFFARGYFCFGLQCSCGRRVYVFVFWFFFLVFW